MARARNIKPGFFTNDELVELPFSTRLLFIGLWTIADREGRLADRPKKIKMEIFPADDVNCDEALGELAGSGFITRYQADGVKVIEIANFAKHQAPHSTEKDSVLPDADGFYTVNERSKNGGVTGKFQRVKAGEQNSNVNPTLDNVIPPSDNALIPDSPILNPDTGMPSSAEAATEQPEQPPEAPTKKPDATATRLPADWMPDQDDIDFCRQNRPDLQPAEVAARFRDYWIAQPGTKGRKTSWPATWRNWVRNEKAPQQPRASPPYQTANDKAKDWADRLTGKNRSHEPDSRIIIDLNDAPARKLG